MSGKNTDKVLSFIEDTVDSLQVKKLLSITSLYSGHRAFGAIFEGQLFLRVSDANQADLEKAQAKFSDELLAETAVMADLSFRQVPTSALKNKKTAASWVHRAIEAGERPLNATAA